MTHRGVLIMSYGSAVTAADVETYLEHVHPGNGANTALVAEFQRRYDLVGRSPLIDITTEQARLLEQELGTRAEASTDTWSVAVGMLHSEPFIATGVQQLLEAGIDELYGFLMSPQYSEILMSGYAKSIAAALEERAASTLPVRLIENWYGTPAYIGVMAARIDEALRHFAQHERDDIPVIFTAHSLPKSVIDRDQGYLDHIHRTVEQIAHASQLVDGQWQFAYQSAGHTPEEWLTPDVKDLFPVLQERGHTAVVVVPTQFLADHLEVLYDIDIAGAKEAEACHIEMVRTTMPNADRAFITALADVALGALQTQMVH